MENSLQHHGILGMKWGVRRSQAQLARISGRSKKEGWSEDAEQAARIKTKKLSQMSNAELQKLNNRRNLENQYKQLNPSSFKKAVTAVAATSAVMGTAIGLYNNSNNLVKIGSTLSSKAMDAVGNFVMSDINRHLKGGL